MPNADMFPHQLPLMLGAAAVFHCCFLVVILFKLSTKTANRILAAILLLFAIRMGACIAGLMFTEIKAAGIYAGSLAFSAIGPLIHFYSVSLWNPSFQVSDKHYYHFISTLAIGLILPLVNIYVAFGMYLFALLSMSIYIVVSAIGLRKNRTNYQSDENRWKWTKYFLSGMILLLALFHAQSLFFDAVIYQGIIIGSALILYGLTWIALNQVKLFMADPKKRDKKLQLQELGQQIEGILRKEEVYTDTTLTVASLAKQLNVPSYLASQAINAHFEKSFPEILNTLRIQKAEGLLTDATKSHYTVEAIAYESGFSTLSAFYTTFKKVNRKTPTEFRNGNQIHK